MNGLVVGKVGTAMKSRTSVTISPSAFVLFAGVLARAGMSRSGAREHRVGRTHQR
jgi:hypothetical protein